MIEHEELPEVPDYISTEQAAKLLGISKQRIYQYIEEKRLPAFRAGNVILLRKEAVEHFKPNMTGRPRKRGPQWRVYRGGSTLLGMDMHVQVRPGQQEHLREKLKVLCKSQTHTFPGTIQRYIFQGKSSPETVSIWLIWKDTEMPDQATQQKNLDAFKAELADVLAWETAEMTVNEGIIYT